MELKKRVEAYLLQPNLQCGTHLQEPTKWGRQTMTVSCLSHPVVASWSSIVLCPCWYNGMGKWGRNKTTLKSRRGRKRKQGYDRYIWWVTTP